MVNQASVTTWRWSRFNTAVSSVYRLAAFVIAVVLMSLFPPGSRQLIPATTLLTGGFVYTALKVLQPLNWHRSTSLNAALFGLDVLVCMFLVMQTGGLESAFVLYTLSPVLTAALLLDRKTTLVMSVITGVYMFAIDSIYPLYIFKPAQAKVSDVLVYMVSVSLFPYLINSRFGQKFQSQAVVEERKRLSRQIHDGLCQTLYGLRWQIQALCRKLEADKQLLPEAKNLEDLAEKAEQSARSSLELLRNLDGNAGLVPQLREYLNELQHDTGIDGQIEVKTPDLRLGELAEFELLCICQEALSNVRKHSGARHVKVQIRSVNSHLELRIADDGEGFKTGDNYQFERHGLAVMQERAVSIGGRLQVHSGPGQGTEIVVEVPKQWSLNLLSALKRT